MEGEQLGKYRLVRQLAVGGMAEIYLATTSGVGGFEKHLALKVIHPNYSSDPEFVRMLVDEAKLSVQLQHRNIVQTFDLGRVGDSYYIVMELIDGVDLFKVLKRTAEQDVYIPVESAVYVAHEVCAGLDYAHRKKDALGRPLNVVHRDVSPQNVLVSFAGEVKLVDFGIAKASLRGQKTAAGVIKGKYYYMSPEQAWGDPLDGRSDIFSAGILLYEMVAGEMMYHEDDFDLLLDVVRKADVAPPSKRRPGVPREIDDLVMGALARDPRDRYQSAAEMARALDAWLRVCTPDYTPSRLGDFARKILGPRDRSQPRLPDEPTSEVQSMPEVTAPIVDENSLIFRVADLRPFVPAETGRDFSEETPAIERLLAPPPVGVGESLGAGGFAEAERTMVDREMELSTLTPVPEALTGLDEADDDADDAAQTGEHEAMRRTDRDARPRLASLDDEEAEGEGVTTEQTRETGASETAKTKPTPLPGVREREETPTVPTPVAVPRAAVRKSAASRAARPIATADATGEVPTNVWTPAPPEEEEDTREVPRPPVVAPRPSVERAAVPQVAPRPSGARPAVAQATAAPRVSASRPAVPQPGALAPTSPASPASPTLPAAPRVSASRAVVAPARTPAPVRSTPAPTGVRPTTPAPAGDPTRTGWPWTQPPADPLPPGSPLETREVRLPSTGRAGWWVALALGASAIALLTWVLVAPSTPARGAIEVLSLPAGANVKIDGRELASRTPVRLDDVDLAAPHRVTVTLPGYDAWERDVRFEPGQREVALQAVLAPQTGTLQIDSTPPGAEVFVNGRFRGTTPLEVGGLLPVDDVAVELRMRGHRVERRTLPWRGARRLTLSVPLDRVR